MLVDVKFGSTSRSLHNFNARAMLGREDSGCELWVMDPSVSRRHAEIWLDGNSVFIRDLGSSNGTWVNGQPVGPVPVALLPGQSVHLGHSSLNMQWQGMGPDAKLTGAPVSAELVAMMAHRAAQAMAPQYAAPPQYAPQQYGAPPQYAPQQYAPQPAYQAPPQQFQPQAGFGSAMPTPKPGPMPMPAAAPAPAPAQSQTIANSPAAYQQSQQQQRAGTGVGATVGVGGTVAPAAAQYSYRRQGGNDNGTLLIALPSDTFANESTLDGFLEFTSTDSETVASVIIELIEFHKRGPKEGHVWDRCLVRQGPWKTQKGDVLAMPFQLRVPSGTSMSSPVCYWTLRGYVDVSWARDIEATAPINMRNTDIEKIRDALGSLDYRIGELEAEPLGQTYRGKFNPPLHLAKQLNITDINLDIEYLGADMKVKMEVEKSRFFSRDKRQEFVFELARLRSATVQDLANHWQTEINKLMS
jgi:hypothetical protein